MDNIGVTKEEYKKMVEQYSPNSNLLMDCLKAFVVGGLICDLGQFITNFLININYSKDEAAMINTITLIFLGSILTGLGIYEKIGKFSGAGSIVPITGFSNSVTAPAIEFKREGLVFGTGAKMFTIAGPVILYGVLTSFVVGIIYYLVK